jgi:hypothetical protein
MSNPINTIPIQQFIQQVKAAELGNQREIRLDIKTAKVLAFSIAELTSRLVQDYEALIQHIKPSNITESISIQMDGGGFSNNV